MERTLKSYCFPYISSLLSGITLLFLFTDHVTCIKSECDPYTYLRKFGYLDSNNLQPNGLTYGDVYTNAINDFQAFSGLSVNGRLDSDTLQMMSLPRCGVRDMPKSLRHKRYLLFGNRWETTNITYKISKYTARLSIKEVDEAIEKAFAVWAEVSPLTFTRKMSGPVHIDIKFVRRNHGDQSPFCGPLGHLAHATPPPGGDTHFDDDEKWTVNSREGINLFQVAAHEFGHALGIGHSHINTSLMFHTFTKFDPEFTLHQDDINAIQELYGKPKNRKPKYDPPSFGGNGLCENTKIDAIFAYAEGIIIVFKGKYFWEVNLISGEKTQPKLITETLPGLPEHIDAAVAWGIEDRSVYFFKGSKFWIYEGNVLSSPLKISEYFNGVPDNLDAAMESMEEDIIYFFKGSKYWAYSVEYGALVNKDHVFVGVGLPSNIDAALNGGKGAVYFFKDASYYEYVRKGIRVTPKNTGSDWFGCPSKIRDNIPTVRTRIPVLVNRAIYKLHKLHSWFHLKNTLHVDKGPFIGAHNSYRPQRSYFGNDGIFNTLKKILFG